ncbi:hypothetical protein Pfo_011096 [Paulownia fortunei]|nr:hypothetical protein Pfo_011096 [Paulownia fortunei]
MTQKLNSSTNCMKTIKFLYSYGGKIVPRPTDGKLRYVGGYTRVLSVDRSITCSELMVKFGESCGSSMNLKCKLPSEDLDVLVSITSDEDLMSVIEEYERASPEAKIRAVLFPIKSVKKVSPPSSPMSCFDFPSASKLRVTAPSATCYYAAPPCAAVHRCSYPAVGYPVTAARNRCYQARSPRHFYHVPHRNHSH